MRDCEPHAADISYSSLETVLDALRRSDPLDVASGSAAAL